MRKKAYISRFFILYLNPVSLGAYAFGCYHLLKFILYGRPARHLPIVFSMLIFLAVWLIICMAFTVRLKIMDKKSEELQINKKHACCKQTLFHIVSVFFVIVFLGITGVTIGAVCCSIGPFML